LVITQLSAHAARNLSADNLVACNYTTMLRITEDHHLSKNAVWEIHWLWLWLTKLTETSCPQWLTWYILNQQSRWHVWSRWRQWWQG